MAPVSTLSHLPKYARSINILAGTWNAEATPFRSFRYTDRGHALISAIASDLMDFQPSMQHHLFITSESDEGIFMLQLVLRALDMLTLYKTASQPLPPFSPPLAVMEDRRHVAHREAAFGPVTKRVWGMDYMYGCRADGAVSSPSFDEEDAEDVDTRLLGGRPLNKSTFKLYQGFAVLLWEDKPQGQDGMPLAMRQGAVTGIALCEQNGVEKLWVFAHATARVRPMFLRKSGSIWDCYAGPTFTGLTEGSRAVASVVVSLMYPKAGNGIISLSEEPCEVSFWGED